MVTWEIIIAVAIGFTLGLAVGLFLGYAFGLGDLKKLGRMKDEERKLERP